MYLFKKKNKTYQKIEFLVENTVHHGKALLDIFGNAPELNQENFYKPENTIKKVIKHLTHNYEWNGS